MHELTELIRQDMKPALGVTEPGAIAFAAAVARQHTKGEVRGVKLRLNSGMFKNAFTCGIPGSDEVGNAHAAALGAVGADPDKGLECLDGITPEQALRAKAMVEAGQVKVEMSEITSRIFIRAEIQAEEGEAAVEIRDSHTNIVRITENGRTVYEKPGWSDEAAGGETNAAPLIHRYTLEQLHTYALTVPAEEIRFIRQAFEMNLALCQAGLASPKTTYARYLLAENGGRVISDDEQKTASLLCNAAIEARVLGLPEPAMSITGSGAHGIIATMPLYAAYKVQGLFGGEASAGRRAELSDLHVYQRILGQAVGLLRLCHRRRHRNGLRPGAFAGRHHGNDDPYHQQYGKQHHGHDLRRRQPGLRHERRGGGGRGLPVGCSWPCRTSIFIPSTASMAPRRSRPCGTWGGLPPPEWWKRRKPSLTFYPEEDKMIVTVQDGGKRGAKPGVKLAYKHAFAPLFTSDEHPMLLVRPLAGQEDVPS